MIFSIAKLFVPAAISFFIGVLITPKVTKFMYEKKLWKGRPRRDQAEMSEAFSKINNTEEETKTPRLGGVIIWISVFITTVTLWILARGFGLEEIARFDFVSRSQTYIPFFALLLGAFVGLIDDFLVIFAKPGRYVDGFPRKMMTVIVLAIGALGAFWFYSKLGMNSVSVPFLGEAISLGIFFIPFFIFTHYAIFTSGVIDGIDGLAGGVMASVFATYGTIAFFQNQIDIAAFCTVVLGGILAFLWFNIPPARFYLGETGMLALTTALTTLLFITDNVFIILIAGLPLVVTSLSSAIQIISKKYFKKKVFLVAPIHHHFEALGWSRAKITMRYWVISIICSMTAIIISLLG